MLIGEIRREPTSVSYPAATFPFIRCETRGLAIGGRDRVLRVDGPALEITDSLVLALRQILDP